MPVREGGTMPAKPSILVVDDEPYLVSGLRRVLERQGYRVSTAADGEAALQLISEANPDVVLLDIMMPGIDGREVCRRAREVSASVQIVYFTAKAEPVDAQGLKELRDEADAFIVKPATVRQILTKIRSVLREGRR